MWLCTQHGFFSIVRKADDEFHVRARVRQDLVNLLKVVVSNPKKRPAILEWPQADYRYRIIISGRALQVVMQQLAKSLDYDNFKGRIAKLPDQRAKYPDYHTMWHSGMCWQNEETAGQRLGCGSRNRTT